MWSTSFSLRLSMMSCVGMGLLGSPLDRLHFIAIGRLVPPHPDPLPRGEGTACADLLLSNARAADLEHSDSNNRRTILPLPWGEGRGGETKCNLHRLICKRC